MTEETVAAVKEYYGKELKSMDDLKTNACSCVVNIPSSHKEILSKIDPEITSKFYGCGSPIPPLLAGKTVLDLGCGTGRDAYLVSALVGEHGKVIGVDMTEEQLAVARKHIDSQMKAFSMSKSNVVFHLGKIEDLDALGIGDNSVDVVISNCVINLSTNKEKVFSEIFRVLKPGGELYFSDVFTDRRLDVAIRDDPVLYGECLGGALYVEDFRRLLSKVGCRDYRVVEQSTITVTKEDLKEKIGNASFISLTVRAFKLPLEDQCEDFGQVATYTGTIAESKHSFVLDDHHLFIAGKPQLVCGNTALMLSATRYADHFTIVGNTENHHGLFDCSEKIDKDDGCC
ncbi:MAG: methyltransferase domain-containing protein [Nanoarchaeota archaeon]|nr:methyltransferase domain-containing protein [Nanoarchaeota archaeon]